MHNSVCLWLAVGLSVALGGCGKRVPPVTEPPTVMVSKPIEAPVTDYLEYTGRTESVEFVEVRPQVSGQLLQLFFKEGSTVKAGDVLCEIDPSTYQAEVDQAAARLDLARAQHAFAEAEYRRTLALRRTNAATQEDVEKALRSQDVARAEIASAVADLERKRIDLARTRILAPITGRTSKSQYTVGNILQGGTPNSSLLTTIVSTDEMYVYFDVAEKELLRLQELIRQGKFRSAISAETETALLAASLAGQVRGGGVILDAAVALAPGRKYIMLPVNLGLANEAGYPRQGLIDFVDNRVNPSTGTLRVRGLFRNDPASTTERKLIPLTAGLFARVRIAIGEPEKRILISERAVGSDQGQKFVYIVNEKNEVLVRPVELGAKHEGLVVVASGLNAGERIIVNGLQRVRPGITVTPKEEPMPRSPVESLSKPVLDTSNQKNN